MSSLDEYNLGKDDRIDIFLCSNTRHKDNNTATPAADIEDDKEETEFTELILNFWIFQVVIWKQRKISDQ